MREKRERGRGRGKGREGKEGEGGRGVMMAVAHRAYTLPLHLP